jgi:O-antigen ligase
MSLLMVLGPVWIKMKFRVKAVTLCFMGAMIFLFAGEQIKLGERIYDLGAYSYLVKAINYGYANCNRLSEAYQAKEANIKGADFNVIGRGAMYGKALGLFVSSPVFGVGEGRFDDVSASCENINELGCIHFFGSSNFDGTTAHNTFLHLLAEEGIFGLAITLIVVVLLYRRVKARSYWLEQYGFNYSIIKMLFWMLLFSAMFNHVLASPLYVLALILPLLMFSSLIIPTHSSRRAVL